MGQCNCTTEYKTSYNKLTYFWEPDKEANRDMKEQVLIDFNTWVSTEEEILRQREYDKSFTTTYNCGSGGECNCFYWRQRSHKDWDTKLEPFDSGGENADPEEPPGDKETPETSPTNTQQLNNKCYCIKPYDGKLIKDAPENGVTPTIKTVDKKTFPIKTQFFLKATEITKDGCQGNVPYHLRYFELPFPVKKDKNGPEVPLKYLLQEQSTKWWKTYQREHACK